MDSKRHRPLNINPFSIQLPLPALISITHRLSGLFLFLCLPALLWCLNMSLESQHSFIKLKKVLTHPLINVLIWLSLAALLFHLLAGMRHLIMDCRIGTSLKGGRLSAWMIVGLFISTMTFLAVYFGGWL